MENRKTEALLLVALILILLLLYPAFLQIRRWTGHGIENGNRASMDSSRDQVRSLPADERTAKESQKGTASTQNEASLSGDAKGVTEAPGIGPGEQKKLQSEIDRLKRTIQKKGKTFQRLIQLADLQKRLGNSEAAEKTLRAAASLRHLNRKQKERIAGLLKDLQAERSADKPGSSKTQPVAAKEAKGKAKEIDKAQAKAKAKTREDPARLAADLKSRGKELFRKEQYNEALKNFQSAKKLLPQDSESVYLEARTLDRLGRSDEAEKGYHKAISLGPDARYYFYLGQLLFQKKRYDRAAWAFGMARKLDPSFIEAIFNLAVSEEKAGRIDQAKKDYQATLGKKPSFWQASLNLGVLLKKEGKRKEALSIMEKAIALTPKEAELHYQKGEILSSFGKRKEAADSYRMATVIEPSLYEAWFNLGLNQSESKEYDSATRSLERAIALHPKDPAPLYELGRMEAAKGDRKSALRELERALQISPGHAGSSIEIVPLYLLANEPDRAKSAMESAMKKNPGNYSVFFNAGNLFRKLESYDAAYDAYRKAIHIDPGSEAAYMNLALAYREKSKFKEAEKVYLDLLSKKGAHSQAHRELGLLYYYDLKENGKAREHLERYLTLDPGSKDAPKIRQLLGQ